MATAAKALYPSNEMIVWTIRQFDTLNSRELYDALVLRQRVFVVEQSCAYLDCDGLDEHALHLFGRSENGDLVAYARIFPPGRCFVEASMGRVVTAPEVRGNGVGRDLMNEALAQTYKAYGDVPIRIGAQQYLERVYSKLGFVTVSDVYDEDGIPHIKMVKSPE